MTGEPIQSKKPNNGRPNSTVSLALLMQKFQGRLFPWGTYTPHCKYNYSNSVM